MKTSALHNPINIDGQTIAFVNQAEYGRVLRSTKGNMPDILQRAAAFQKALGSIISCGLAYGRSSNPSSSLRILTIYETPVLMSAGLASLVLSSKEVACIDTRQSSRTLSSCQYLLLKHDNQTSRGSFACLCTAYSVFINLSDILVSTSKRFVSPLPAATSFDSPSQSS